VEMVANIGPTVSIQGGDSSVPVLHTMGPTFPTAFGAFLHSLATGVSATVAIIAT
jgi:hypothetical protein